MKKTSYADKQKRMRQIFALVMAILMILGTVAIVIPYVSAADETGSSDVAEVTVDTQNEGEPDDGLLLRIGLMYGTGVTESFAIRANDGFLFSDVAKNNTRKALFKCSSTYVAVCKDANLTKTDGIYASATSGLIIGGYHLELPTQYNSADAVSAAVDEVNARLKNAGLHSNFIYAFPVYRAKTMYIRIGDFASSASANNKLSSVSAAVGESPTVVSPNSEMMTLVDPDKNLILFEFASQDGDLGVIPLQRSGAATENEIYTPANNGYKGVFLFDRYGSGVSVVNLIGLEPYVAGVLPYEISSSWNYEAIKAFACIVRSFTLSNRGKHTSLGFDLCNSTNCQVYAGTKRQNDAVLRAVDETRGIVITYNDKICNTFYSAVTGGSTVNSEQIWNGTAYPYLRAVETPWEDYASHSYGEWVKEYTPSDLYNRLKSRLSNFKLEGTIASVTITELAENSDYVYKLTVADPDGNTYTFKGTDIIRTGLGLNSANFVIGYNGDIPILNKPLSMITKAGESAVTLAKASDKTTTQIMTADGVKEIDVTNGMDVLTDEGVITLDETMKSYDISDEAKEALENTQNKFLFIGKGWGHGGGISQWGAKNLADMGSTYEGIIHAYFTDVTLKSYRSLPAYAKE